MPRHRGRVVAAAKGEKVHEEAVVGSLRDAVFECALFAQIRRLDAFASLVHSAQL
jgi:hypothetical protein